MPITAVTTHSMTLYVHRVGSKWHGEAVCSCAKWEFSCGATSAARVASNIGAHFCSHYLRSVR